MKALAYFEGSVLCVAESQAPRYREVYPDIEIVVHPDQVVGLGAKRDWIYAKFGDVAMVDDDVSGLYCLHEDRVRLLTAREARQRIEATAETARAMGAYLFGFNAIRRPDCYHANAPFALKGKINGCLFGILAGSKIRFTLPEPTVAVEDYIASLFNAYHHRYLLLDNRFAPHQEYISVGGQARYRSGQTEKSDNEILRKYFGEAVVVRRHCRFAASHAHQRRINLPW